MQPLKIGSSETTREAPLDFDNNFDFSLYLQTYQPQHKKNTSSKFLEWFVGFVEGVGSFEMSEKRCAFIINQKDEVLLHIIRSTLGFGSVTQQTNYLKDGSCSTYWRFSVYNYESCVRLAAIFNGHLILDKVNTRFHNWLDKLDRNIQYESNRVDCNLNNGWLSGFIDAEGGFHARLRKNSRMQTKLQFQHKYYVSQKGEFKLLSQIKEVCETTSSVYTFEQNGETYNRIDMCSFHSAALILSYLKKYPCRGRKRLAIVFYRRLLGYCERQEHLTLEGLDKMKPLIRRLKQHNARSEEQ
jgi:hypothetical protein